VKIEAVDTQAAAPAETATPGRHRRAMDGGDVRSAAVYCLKIFVAVRVVIVVLAMISVAVLPHVPEGGVGSSPVGQLPGPVSVPGWPAHEIRPGWNNAVTSWERFDALWYLQIAAHGYADHDGSAAFYPLFPVLTRGVSVLIGGHTFAAGMLVANGAAFGALLLLYLLTRSELSEETARSAVLFAAIFPTAFFFLSPYSESLFLLLVVGSFLAARRRRWWLAALAGALAALTRNIGVLMALPLAVEAVHQAFESPAEHRPRAWLPLAASLGPPAGAAVYLWYWRLRIHDWLAPIHQQNGWQRQLSGPVKTLTSATGDAFRFLGIYPGGYHLLDWLVAIPVLALAVYAVVNVRPSYSVYLWAGILAPMAFIFKDRPLMSFPRFALVLFPVYWAMARLTEGSRLRRELAVAASAAMLGLLLLLFVNWYYVF
jgi:mannosyltransferase PIG-V